MRRILGQTHLVQSFPDAYTRLGRIRRIALVRQSALALLLGLESGPLCASTMIENGFLMIVHAWSFV